MSKKKYVLLIVLLAVATAALLVTNQIWEYLSWLWVALIVMTAFTFLRSAVYAPLQAFGTKFTMLVDYDLDLTEACRLAKKGLDEAATANIRAIYEMYYGMGLYYAGDYEGAIRTFNLINLKKLPAVYHVLIVAFLSYAALELGDTDAFKASLERLRGLRTMLSPRYQNFAANYLEILEAIDGLEADPEKYRTTMEKHFARDDGYISTRLIYNYRLAHYYRIVGDEAEMDKRLAFVIANGKAHHTVERAKAFFKGTVDPADFVIRENVEEPVEPETPTEIEAPADETEKKPEGE